MDIRGKRESRARSKPDDGKGNRIKSSPDLMFSKSLGATFSTRQMHSQPDRQNPNAALVQPHARSARFRTLFEFGAVPWRRGSWRSSRCCRPDSADQQPSLHPFARLRRPHLSHAAFRTTNHCEGMTALIESRVCLSAKCVVRDRHNYWWFQTIALLIVFHDLVSGM